MKYSEPTPMQYRMRTAKAVGNTPRLCGFLLFLGGNQDGKIF